MRPDIGTVWADDGWRLEWNLARLPHAIRVYNAGTVLQYNISGDIPHRHLDREIRQFLRDHAKQQMVMEW